MLAIAARLLLEKTHLHHSYVSIVAESTSPRAALSTVYRCARSRLVRRAYRIEPERRHDAGKYRSMRTSRR